jgi:hypothetical protein
VQSQIPRTNEPSGEGFQKWKDGCHGSVLYFHRTLNTCPAGEGGKGRSLPAYTLAVFGGMHVFQRKHFRQ